MFDFSFAEILLIVAAVVIFIKPKDLPVIIKAFAKFVLHIRGFINEIKQTFDDIARESGVHDIKKELDAEMRLIKGDDGNMYESYHVPKLEEKKHDKS